MSDLVKLKDVCHKITDGSHYSPKGTSDGFPMLSVKDMSQNGFDATNCKYISRKDFEDLVKADCKPLKNDILIAKDGSYLKHVFVVKEEKDEVILSSIGILRPNLLKIDPYYLKYYLHTKSVKETVSKKYVSGSALPRIILKNFGEIEIITRPLIDQQKIASVLSTLDDKIELNNKINAELEAMAKLIYDYWFVQFDFPFDFKQNKMADESSNPEDVKPYKSSGGKMVYNEELKREIPEGWEVKNLSNFIAKDKSGDWGKEEPQGNYNVEVNCIRGADINGINGKGDIKAPKRYILEKNHHKLLEKNDLVIEISGGSPIQSTGRLACITEDVFKRFKNSLICSNFCKAISLYNEYELFYFIFSWNKAYDNDILFGFESKTSGIKNLLFEVFINDYKVATPTDELLNKFNSKMKLFEKKKQHNLNQNQQLSELRDWLLPMLMNGQVKVKDAYEKMEEIGMAAEGDVRYESSHTLSIPPNKKGFAKLVLAGKIIKECKDNKEFTNIKFQKLQHLAEHLMEADLNLNYYNQAAGPYDNRFMHTLHKRMKQQKWFDSYGYKYSSMEKNKEIDGFFNGYFSAKNEQFTKLIKLLGKATENQCEIISTLYAIWNDRIIKGEPIENELLIEDFLNWSKRKQKYTENQLHDAIQWMKDKQIEPKGFGKLIKHAKKRKS